MNFGYHITILRFLIVVFLSLQNLERRTTSARDYCIAPEKMVILILIRSFPRMSPTPMSPPLLEASNSGTDVIIFVSVPMFFPLTVPTSVSPPLFQQKCFSPSVYQVPTPMSSPPFQHRCYHFCFSTNVFLLLCLCTQRQRHHQHQRLHHHLHSSTDVIIGVSPIVPTPASPPLFQHRCFSPTVS